MPGSTGSCIGSTPMDGFGSGAAISVTSNVLIFAVDTTGYNGVSVQVTSAGTTCTITYETSNDNATWVATNGLPVASATAASTSTGTGIMYFPALGQYFRARVSTYTSGTVTVWYWMKNTPLSVA